MNERIKELAEQAGLVTTWEGWVSTHQEHAEGVSDEFLERFAELVRQDEREVKQMLIDAIVRIVNAACEIDISHLDDAVDHADTILEKVEKQA